MRVWNPMLLLRPDFMKNELYSPLLAKNEGFLETGNNSEICREKVQIWKKDILGSPKVQLDDEKERKSSKNEDEKLNNQKTE